MIARPGGDAILVTLSSKYASCQWRIILLVAAHLAEAAIALRGAAESSRLLRRLTSAITVALDISSYSAGRDG